MSPRAKTVLVVIAGLAVVNGVLRGIDSISGGEPGGPTSSAYATGPRGLGAYAELLGRAGHPVERVRGRASGRSLPSNATVVVLDPDFVSAADGEALVNFVARGGRLVAGGSGSAWLRRFTGTTANRVVADDVAGPVAPAAETGGVSRVASSGIAWERTGRALPVLGGRDGALLAVGAGGRALLLADAATLQNRLLAHEDNAALGLNLAGPRARPVLFLEGYHGFGSASGIGAIPNAWLAALALLGLAALVFMLARGRRLGPPEAAERELPPPRREYVDSLGATLARTRQPGEALAPLVTHVRTEVARRAGLPLYASPDELVAAGIRLGLAPDDARAVLAPPPGTVDVLAAGRVLAAVEGDNEMNELRDRVTAEVRKVVLGQDDVVEAVLTALLVGGHALLEGVPGVAKTLLANATARALDLPFGRVQFTPDMLPSDLTGTMALRAGELTFRSGPVFTSVLLADEINRTPPKTQAALLEAMQEGQVTVEGVSRPLPDPFIVVATQNPIEYEGTYPLPEAQLDRFLVKVDVGYPSESDERAMLGLRRDGVSPGTLDDIEAVAGAAELRAARGDVDATAVTDEVAEYIVAIVRQTRTLPSVELGASPRAAVHLLAASKATARLAERGFVTPDDVAAVAPAVLRHRLILRPEAELDRYTPDDAVEAALQAVPVPR